MFLFNIIIVLVGVEIFHVYVQADIIFIEFLLSKHKCFRTLDV